MTTSRIGSRLATAAKIVGGCVAGVLLLPVILGLWMARGDPDIRIEQHRRYLEGVRPADPATAPNIVLVFADDLGYGDVGSFASTPIRTPHVDALASSGVRLTNFYSASSICSPSRFSLLTGRYPARGFVHSVFFPSGTLMGLLVNNLMFPHGVRGILPDEVTVAEALRAAGYSTGMFGKWHLGDRSPHLPTDQGFEYFLGSYYSNDMQPYALYKGEEIEVEAPVDQSTLTIRLTESILDFIDRSADSPFFVYYASPFPHVPLHASDRFAGRSEAGTYGDCVEELDWSVGEIRRRLVDRGLADRTLFLFTSDNGPWHEGSPGGRRGRKANSFAGGHAVPMIASWPGTIPESSQVSTAAMTTDLFPTILAAAGVPPPADRRIDGLDLMPALLGSDPAPADRRLYFARNGKFAAVLGPEGLKHVAAHRSENSAYWMAHHGPFLFDVNADPSESYDVSARFPDIGANLAQELRLMNSTLGSNPRGWLEAH